MVFLDVTIPVFLVASIGFVFGKVFRTDLSVVGRIVFYVFGPALIFRSVYQAELASNEVAKIVTFVVLLHVALFAVSRIVCRVRKWDEDTRSVAGLVLTLGNYGTYGLPVVLFAFGEDGLACAVVFFVCSVLLQSTLGVGIAAWRRGERVWGALLTVFRVPWIYAFVAAVGARLVGWDLPDGLLRTVELVAAGAIPMQLLLLGMELSRLNLRAMAEATMELSLARILIAPLFGFGLAAMLGIHGLLRSVLIVQASMPSAINAMILAVRYNRRPELAAGVVFVTTLLSLGTLTLIPHLVG